MDSVVDSTVIYSSQFASRGLNFQRAALEHVFEGWASRGRSVDMSALPSRADVDRMLRSHRYRRNRMLRQRCDQPMPRSTSVFGFTNSGDNREYVQAQHAAGATEEAQRTAEQASSAGQQRGPHYVHLMASDGVLVLDLASEPPPSRAATGIIRTSNRPGSETSIDAISCSGSETYSWLREWTMEKERLAKRLGRTLQGGRGEGAGNFVVNEETPYLPAKLPASVFVEEDEVSGDLSFIVDWAGGGGGGGGGDGHGHGHRDGDGDGGDVSAAAAAMQALEEEEEQCAALAADDDEETVPLASGQTERRKRERHREETVPSSPMMRRWQDDVTAPPVNGEAESPPAPVLPLQPAAPDCCRVRLEWCDGCEHEQHHPHLTPFCASRHATEPADKGSRRRSKVPVQAAKRPEFSPSVIFTGSRPGYVYSSRSRFFFNCLSRSTCTHSNLLSFTTAEEAALAWLLHMEASHPADLAALQRKRAHPGPPLPASEPRLLMHDTEGYLGVVAKQSLGYFLDDRSSADKGASENDRSAEEGNQAYMLGHFPAALECYQKSMEHSSLNEALLLNAAFTSLNIAGSILIEGAVEGEETKRLLESKLTALNNAQHFASVVIYNVNARSPQAYCCRGIASLRKKEYWKCKSDLRELLRLQPDNSVAVQLTFVADGLISKQRRCLSQIRQWSGIAAKRAALKAAFKGLDREPSQHAALKLDHKRQRNVPLTFVPSIPATKVKDDKEPEKTLSPEGAARYFQCMVRYRWMKAARKDRFMKEEDEFVDADYTSEQNKWVSELGNWAQEFATEREATVAAICIQACWRMYSEFRQRRGKTSRQARSLFVPSTMKDPQEAAIRIQAAWRAGRVRRADPLDRVRNALREEMANDLEYDWEFNSSSAPFGFQMSNAWMSAADEWKDVEESEKSKDLAALRIQSTWRASKERRTIVGDLNKVRQMLRDEVLHDLEQDWTGTMGASDEWQKIYFAEASASAAVCVQRWWRKLVSINPVFRTRLSKPVLKKLFPAVQPALSLSQGAWVVAPEYSPTVEHVSNNPTSRTKPTTMPILEDVLAPISLQRFARKGAGEKWARAGGFPSCKRCARVVENCEEHEAICTAPFVATESLSLLCDSVIPKKLLMATIKRFRDGLSTTNEDDTWRCASCQSPQANTLRFVVEDTLARRSWKHQYCSEFWHAVCAECCSGPPALLLLPQSWVSLVFASKDGAALSYVYLNTHTQDVVQGAAALCAVLGVGKTTVSQIGMHCHLDYDSSGASVKQEKPKKDGLARRRNVRALQLLVVFTRNLPRNIFWHMQLAFMRLRNFVKPENPRTTHPQQLPENVAVTSFPSGLRFSLGPFFKCSKCNRSFLKDSLTRHAVRCGTSYLKGCYPLPRKARPRWQAQRWHEERVVDHENAAVQRSYRTAGSRSWLVQRQQLYSGMREARRQYMRELYRQGKLGKDSAEVSLD